MRGPIRVMVGPTWMTPPPCAFLSRASVCLAAALRARESRSWLDVAAGTWRPATHSLTPTAVLNVYGRYCLSTFWSWVSVWLSRYRRRAVTAVTSNAARARITTASTPARTRVRSWVRRSRAGVGRTRPRGPMLRGPMLRGLMPRGLRVMEARLSFQIRQAQAVAHRPLGMDDVRPVLGQLAPQVGDVGRDDGAGAAEVVVPHVVQYLCPGQHAPRVEHQVAQQAELGRGQVDQVSVPADLVAVLVQLDVGEGEHRADRLAGAGPAQHGPDPGGQFLQAEGLGQVVIAAQGQAGHLVGLGVTGGEEDHRHPAAVPAQPPHDVE